MIGVRLKCTSAVRGVLAGGFQLAQAQFGRKFRDVIVFFLGRSNGGFI